MWIMVKCKMIEVSVKDGKVKLPSGKTLIAAPTAGVPESGWKATS
jgi:hypothetical protein